jgi:hypothetical protein
MEERRQGASMERQEARGDGFLGVARHVQCELLDRGGGLLSFNCSLATPARRLLHADKHIWGIVLPLHRNRVLGNLFLVLRESRSWHPRHAAGIGGKAATMCAPLAGEQHVVAAADRP